MKKNIVSIHLCFMLSTVAFAGTHHVGTGQTHSNLSQAAAVAIPGDTILVHQGTYGGGTFISNLQGNASQWIYIHAVQGETVTYSGGSSAWQFSDGAYLHMKGFIFQQQTSNGVNMDDGGSYNTPSHHLVFDSCTFRDINATGNNDLLKMSGVDDFEIRNCIFLNGSTGAGDAIDMVGCHDGLIKNCRFENMGAASIQAKGGCRNIRIEANFFKDAGSRSLNLGGSTGLAFFRPINAPYEAADLKVYSNIFIGSEAPIAYVGCINTEVVNNTIYVPTKWVIRILQETVDTTRFLPCGNNTFRNNIIYLDNQVTTQCNIGTDTDPQSFTFSNDLWFHSQNSSWAGPSLPVTDANRIVGQNPLFVNASLENFDLQSGSPAIGNGFASVNPVQDYTRSNFHTPRSIGAFEGNTTTGIKAEDKLQNKINAYPNPFSESCIVDLSSIKKSAEENLNFHLYNLLGKEVASYMNISANKLTIHRKGLGSGVYIYKVMQNNQQAGTGKLIVQ